MIASTYPLAAADCTDVCNLSYSAAFSAITALGSAALEISSAYIIFAASFESIIPIEACGHANSISAPVALLFIATYALPIASPTTTLTLGTVAPANALVSAATLDAMLFSEHTVAENPLTLVSVSTGMTKASQ